MTSGNEKIERISSEAFQLMTDYGISLRPQNYRVWYEFAAGSTPGLNLAVETLQKSNKSVNEEATVALYNEFFNNGAALTKTVEITGNQLSEKLTSALELIHNAGKGTEAYGAALDSITSNLGGQSEEELSGGGLQSIVDTLVTATKEMSDHTKSLEKRLKQNTTEVEELRANLHQARMEAITDQLTKLGNRKHFDAELEKAALESEKTGQPLCLVMSDIDKFKNFNDTWGHQTGDQVLRLVAACLKKEVRDTDIPARYGGEEFGLILPASGLEDAVRVAEKVRASVESKKVMKRSTGEDLGTITISMGVALYQPGEDLAKLVERADTCLYQAKDAGRNRVIREGEVTEVRQAS